MQNPKLNRRQTMLALGSAAGAASLPNISFAGELASLNIGSIEVSSLSDGTFNIPAGWFPNADPDDLKATGEKITIGVNQWLIKSAERLILVDTGAGPLFEGVGQLDALLSAQGISPAEITDIILTHMHSDHIGGLARPEAGGFANARIYISEAEWNFWMDPELTTKMPAEMHDTIRQQQDIMTPLADRVTRHSGETDLGDGLTLIPLPGHTPGHSGVKISDGSQELLIVGDAILSEALQFAHPEYTYILDIDPAQAVATRSNLFNQLAETQIPFAATHLTYPGIGHVRRAGTGFVFQPLT